MYRVSNYQNENLLKYKNLSRNFLFVSVIISLSYIAETYATGFQSFGAIALYNLIFAFLIITLVVIYRILRWREINSAHANSLIEKNLEIISTKDFRQWSLNIKHS